MSLLPFDWGDLDLVTVDNQYHKATLSLESGQLLKWEVKNGHKSKDILYHGSSISRTGIPILFPFADSLEKGIYNHTNWPIQRHGFGRNLTWTLENLTEDEVIISLADKDLCDELKQAYPFKFKVYLMLDFSKPSIMTYSIKVENLGEEIMAIAPGIHPYINLKNDQKSTVKIAGIKNFDASKINWESKMDGGMYYDFNKMARVAFPDFTLDIQGKSPDINNCFSQLVIWSQPSSMNDSDFICVESFTRPINGINEDPILIQSGETWKGVLEFKVS